MEIETEPMEPTDPVEEAPQTENAHITPTQAEVTVVSGTPPHASEAGPAITSSPIAESGSGVTVPMEETKEDDRQGLLGTSQSDANGEPPVSLAQPEPQAMETTPDLEGEPFSTAPEMEKGLHGAVSIALATLAKGRSQTPPVVLQTDSSSWLRANLKWKKPSPLETEEETAAVEPDNLVK